MAKKTSLNKGLEALLGDVVAPKETKTPTKNKTTKTFPREYKFRFAANYRLNFSF